MANGRIVGAPATRGEGEDKVSGRARYTADMAVPGMLWCKVLRSPIAHGRIARIDAGKALAAPGVRSVVTGADLSGARIGKKLVDMPLLADGVVRYIGEKVAAVAADSEAEAEAAAPLIDVEYEEMAAVLDPVEAAEPSAPLIHPEVTTYPGLLQPMDAPSNVAVRLEWRKGDVEAAFREADLVVENTYTTPAVHHGYIEPHCCIVEAKGEGADVWASTKSLFALRDHMAGALGIPADRVIAHPGYLGGDFGGKGDANDLALCYVLSKNTGKPVKYLMDYTEELIAGNPRHASVTTVKTGVKRNGLIVAQHMDLLFDSGAYGSYRPQGYLVGAHSSGGPYKIAHFLLVERYVYTNKVPCGYMRAPGHPQGFFANESQLDLWRAGWAWTPRSCAASTSCTTATSTPPAYPWGTFSRTRPWTASSRHRTTARPGNRTSAAASLWATGCPRAANRTLTCGWMPTGTRPWGRRWWTWAPAPTP